MLLLMMLLLLHAAAAATSCARDTRYARTAAPFDASAAAAVPSAATYFIFR